MSSGMVYSEEIAPFRITGADGELYARFFMDDYDSSTGDNSTDRHGETFETGLDLTLKSYIYHPNFINLDFGGGPVYVHHTYDIQVNDEEITDTSHDAEYFNFHVKARILDKKPYPLTLYYDKHTSSTPYAVQDRMLLTRENYGLNFKLKQPLLPFKLAFNLNRYDTDGDNYQRITDERIDRASLKLTGDLGADGNWYAGHYWTYERSGSRAATISDAEFEPRKRITHLTEGKTENYFGLDRELRLIQRLSYREQNNNPELHEFRYTPSLYWRHSQQLRTTYRYGFVSKSVEGRDSTTNSLDFGLGHTTLDSRLETTLDAHTDIYDTEGFQQKYADIGAQLSYRQPLGNYEVTYTGGWGADYTIRESSTDRVLVTDEVHTFDALSTFELDNINVDEASIQIIDDVDETPYSPGTDYEVQTSGETTRIEWLDPDEIPERLRVSYAYFVDSTDFYGLRELYRAELRRGRLFKVFGQYRDYERHLISGNPTIPLNSKETLTFGVDVNYPLTKTLTIGANAEHERHNADVGSYRRNSLGGYFQVNKILKGNVRLFADSDHVDRLESDVDIELLRAGVRFYSRPWNRTTFNADYVYETDDGGTRKRSNTRASARLNWSYRKLRVSAEYRHDENEFGDSSRDRDSLNLYLTRKF